ncbi:MAG: hypothetical protein A2V64_00780 [Bacteroidetes bacterium RBG_13_43_22]|nr:MAG: hypothetical protein A2V64_00780 [Bacteroidetes bacterium RBG_13_43_22]
MVYQRGQTNTVTTVSAEALAKAEIAMLLARREKIKKLIELNIMNKRLSGITNYKKPPDMKRIFLTIRRKLFN